MARSSALGTLGDLLIVFSAKLMLLYFLYEVLTFVFDKARLLTNNFVQNSFDYSCISLSAFNSGTYLRLHSISQNPKLVKKIIRNLNLSKDSNLDSIPVVVMKKCEYDFS